MINTNDWDFDISYILILKKNMSYAADKRTENGKTKE